MLARDGDVTGNRIGPARSSCAVHVGSYNSNRESIYVQQQTISGRGPQRHRVQHQRAAHRPRRQAHETEDSAPTATSRKNNDNNAIMAQLLMQGTNYVNFIGRYCWVAAGEHGLYGRRRHRAGRAAGRHRQHAARAGVPRALRGARRARPRAGARPRASRARHRRAAAAAAARKPRCSHVQARGEYLYAACGEGGLRVFDIAFIDDKGFSERITTAPVSPLGQQFYVPTKYADARRRADDDRARPDAHARARRTTSQTVHPLYGYIYVADKYEGLILVGAGTLLDGNPLEQLPRARADVQPGRHARRRAARHDRRHLRLRLLRRGPGGRVDSTTRSSRSVTASSATTFLKQPDGRAGAVPLRLRLRRGGRQGARRHRPGQAACRCATLRMPEAPQHLPGPDLRLRRRRQAGAGDPRHRRTPRRRSIDQVYNADGCINDLHDVKLGITYVSEFAYLADGKNGLRVVQLTSPETPGNDGFSPRPTPRLIATYKIPKGGDALAVAEGARPRPGRGRDAATRSRVFGRVGARPLNVEEQRRMYLHPLRGLWRVFDGAARLLDRRPRAARSQARRAAPADLRPAGWRQPSCFPLPAAGSDQSVPRSVDALREPAGSR